ncbi:MAG: hypothetical protein AB7P35_17820 [Hyphomonadaceae bacterium]
MTSPDDARDIAIHRTIDGYVCLIMAMHDISREEAIDRLEAFAESEREEMRERRAYLAALGEGADA